MARHDGCDSCIWADLEDKRGFYCQKEHKYYYGKNAMDCQAIDDDENPLYQYDKNK